MLGLLFGPVRDWLTRPGAPWADPEDELPLEVKFLRALGLGVLIFLIVGTATTEPEPGLRGDGLVVLVALVVMLVTIAICNPRAPASQRTRIAALLAFAAAGLALEAAQPNGVWEICPYFIVVVASMRLPTRPAFLVLALSLLAYAALAAVETNWGAGISSVAGAIPWFLVIRQMRRLGEQKHELQVSQAAERTAAAAAERGHLAREMHDVLAHTLSALALQLESTRLLARDRDAGGEVVQAIDRAHHLAAAGLEEARHAISTARGDAPPGPERLVALVEAFVEQSGLDASLRVHGEARELPADQRLAIYRTAQEALTNIRRHAAPDRVEIDLSYLPAEVVLTIEDLRVAAPEPVTAPAHAGAGRLAAALAEDGPEHGSVGGGYGLTGMRERAELLGGNLTAETTAGGFRVELHLPA